MAKRLRERFAQDDDAFAIINMSSISSALDNVTEDGHCLYQEGRAVYRHAVLDMFNATKDLMARNHLTVDDVTYLVPHQANLRIIEAVGSRLGIDPAKVLVNIQKVGNTSAASVPLCLDEYKHLFKKGDKIVLTAFGAGFTWGAEYLIWD